MTYRLLNVTPAACCMVWLLLSSLAVTGAPRQHSVLQGVAALEKPVTYSETKIALGDLVRKVVEDTGVPLTAARDVADEPVAVVVKAMPARDLLQQLAELLDYQWSRRRAGSGAAERGENGASDATARRLSSSPVRYEVGQDLASKQREEALREAARAEAERRLQEAVRLAAEMAALPQAELQAIVDAGPSTRRAPVHTPEDLAQRQRLMTAEMLLSPASREMALLLAGLSSAQWSALRRQGEIVFSSDPAPGELPLAARTISLFRASRPSMESEFRGGPPDVQEGRRQREAAQQDLWQAATGYRVVFRLDAAQLQASGAARLSAEARPIRSGVPTQAPGAAGGVVPRFLGGAGTRLDLSAGPAYVLQEMAEESQHQKELEKDPVLGAARTFKPASIPGISPVYAGGWWLRDLLPDLARAYAVDFISDAYWSAAPIFTAELAREPAPLFRLLDAAAGPLQHWERRGRLIRLGSRKWFFDRPREVPLRLVRRWQGSCVTRGALPVEEWVEMMGALSEPQLEAVPGLLTQAELPSDLAVAPFVRHAVWFYASLAPVQREALWHDKAISLEQLTAGQRDLLAGAVLESSRLSGTVRGVARAAASVSLMRRRRVHVVVRLGGRYRYHDEPAGEATTPLMVPSRAEAGGLSRSPAAASAVPSPRRLPVISLQLQVGDGSEVPRTVGFTVAQP